MLSIGLMLVGFLSVVFVFLLWACLKVGGDYGDHAYGDYDGQGWPEDDR